MDIRTTQLEPGQIFRGINSGNVFYEQKTIITFSSDMNII